jgi:hypothetical protein
VLQDHGGFVSRRIPLLAEAVALTYGAFAVFEEFSAFIEEISPSTT